MYQRCPRQARGSIVAISSTTKSTGGCEKSVAREAIRSWGTAASAAIAHPVHSIPCQHRRTFAQIVGVAYPAIETTMWNRIRPRRSAETQAPQHFIVPYIPCGANHKQAEPQNKRCQRDCAIALCFHPTRNPCSVQVAIDTVECNGAQHHRCVER